MVGRSVWVVMGVLIAASTVASTARGEPQVNRQDVVEIGSPVPISRQVLRAEMGRNNELREYIETYGYPDYAEVQEIRPQWPWAAYEVRTYYLRRNIQISFARVNVSPTVRDFGVTRFAGRIARQTLDRLLTAERPPQSTTVQ